MVLTGETTAQAPATCARFVTNPDADNAAAWRALVAGVGATEARTLVAALPGGPAALTRIGVAQ